MKNNFIQKFNNVMQNALTKKSTDELVSAGKHSELKKTLNAFDLIILGIGAVVGTGIFTIVGIAAQGGDGGIAAGPSLTISMIIAAVACVFSALCYSEFASMIPVAGSAYTYTYATMGEFMAWMVGWILMLEYAIGNITVACAWTGYFMQLLKGFEHILPNWLVNPPIWLINDYRSALAICNKEGLNPHDVIPYLGGVIPISVNVPAIFIVIVLTLLLVKGVRESTKAATIMVFINLFIILSFIVVGAFYVKPENWVPFAPNGFEGIFSGAFIIFFAYIGFDAISTAAEETKNPQKDLPIGILGTLILCTILYVAAALVLTGMVDYNMIDIQAPIASAMRMVGQNRLAGFISVGALAGLTSVLLVYQLGTTRILYAICRDKFLPKGLRRIHRHNRTPYILTWLSAVVVILGSLVMNLQISAELCNFGTFLSFIIVCAAVMILRKTEPNRPRAFKVPFVPLFPILGILMSGSLMIYSMKTLTTSSLWFVAWLIVGVWIYACYGYGQKRIEEHRKNFYNKK